MADEYAKDRLTRILTAALSCEMKNEVCPYDYLSCDICIEQWINDLKAAMEMDKTIKIEISCNGEKVTEAKVKGW